MNVWILPTPVRLLITTQRDICLLLTVVVTAIVLSAALLQETSFTTNQLQLFNFYATERNQFYDYAFTKPTAYALVTPPHQPTLLELRAFSPSPLPARPISVTYDLHPAFSHSLDATPRVMRVLLPEHTVGKHPGLLIGIATTGTRLPQDPRELGLLVDYVRVKELTDSRSVPRPTLFIVAIAGLVSIPLLGYYRKQLHRSVTAQQVPYTASELALAVVMVGYALVLARYSMLRHARFGSDAYDLGVFDQWLWLISRGEVPFSTALGLHVLGDHAALVLYPLAMLYWLLPDVSTLLTLQTLVVVAGAVPLYVFGRAAGSPWLGLLAAVAYLAHPATHNLLLIDFHTDALAATALLIAVVASERRAWPLVIVCCLSVLACKENFAITTTFFGLWLVLQRHWRVGGLIVVASLLWFLLATRFVIPAYNGGQVLKDVGRFTQFGGSPSEIAQTMVLRPDLVLRELLVPAKLLYLAALVGPFALLPLLGPRYLVLALPSLGLNLLSRDGTQHTIIFHYHALIVAFCAMALLDGLLHIRRRSQARSWVLGLSVFALLGALLAAQAMLPTSLVALRAHLTNAEARTQLRAYVLSHLPSDANVSVQSKFQPHVSQRQQAFLFPNPFERVAFWNADEMPFTPDVEYIVYDRKFPDDFYAPAVTKLAVLDQLVRDQHYVVMLDLDGMQLLHRKETK